MKFSAFILTCMAQWQMNASAFTLHPSKSSTYTSNVASLRTTPRTRGSSMPMIASSKDDQDGSIFRKNQASLKSSKAAKAKAKTVFKVKPSPRPDDFIKQNFEDDARIMARSQSSSGRVLGPKHALAYDTSLRDGTQGESVSVSCDNKLKIAERLAEFQLDYIEAGWPGSNPKDAEFFERAKTELSQDVQSKLVAFGSTRRKNILAKDDGQIRALVESGAPTICMVAKGHLWQVTDIIRATPEQNIEMISDSVSYLVGLGKRVFVDLEHFFDGFNFDPDYSMKCCQAAVEAGAEGLVLCDTNGGSMPWDVGSITAQVVDSFDVTVGIHAHNDCGMAVANSIMAVKNGCGLVQGTINGIGERTGNADLCSILPTLAFHVDSKITCSENLSDLTSLSRFVDETMNRKPDSSAPYVGASAFAHKGGLHVAAMERSPMSYQHIEPNLVGNGEEGSHQ